jgi:hypothetical protein
MARYADNELAFDTGFKLVRIMCLTNYWNADQTLPGLFTLESIPPEADRFIDEYADNGVTVVLTLWLGADLAPYETTFRTQDELDKFNEHVRFVVDHFKGRIPYYEIWNEPGIMTAEEYAGLVRSTVPVIREADPQAKIIIGATPGNWEPDFPGYGDYQRSSMDIELLHGLLRSGVAPMVDGISWHPLYDHIAEDPYYQGYPAMLQGIKDLAESQGFTGQYFADELLWRTVTEAAWAGGPPVSAVVAAKHYTRAITLHRGYGVNVTINTFFIEPAREWIDDDAMWPIRNVAKVLAGAQPAALPVTVTGEVENVSQYAFTMENGDRLVGLWINGTPAEDDPGTPVKLTLPGASAQQVVAIDVLHGFEQELVQSAAGGDLVIEGFLLKDYPIFIRLLP